MVATGNVPCDVTPKRSFVPELSQVPKVRGVTLPFLHSLVATSREDRLESGS